MAINRISRANFNRFLSQPRVLESLMGEQIEWFGNPARNLIGTIARNKVGRSWNYAILRQTQPGHFDVCDVGENFYSLRQTGVQFRYAMAGAE